MEIIISIELFVKELRAFDLLPSSARDINTLSATLIFKEVPVRPRAPLRSAEIVGTMFLIAVEDCLHLERGPSLSCFLYRLAR